MPLLGIRNKFIDHKYWVQDISGIINIGYNKYRVSEISSIRNMGYQKYQVPYQIYWVSDILGIENIGYKNYWLWKISGIRNIAYQKYKVSCSQSQISSKVIYLLLLLFIDKATISLRLSIRRLKPKFPPHCLHLPSPWVWFLC